MGNSREFRISLSFWTISTRRTVSIDPSRILFPCVCTDVIWVLGVLCTGSWNIHITSGGYT